MGCTTKVCMCVSYQLRRSSNPQWIFSNAAQRQYCQAVTAGAQQRQDRQAVAAGAHRQYRQAVATGAQQRQYRQAVATGAQQLLFKVQLPHFNDTTSVPVFNLFI